MDRDRRSYGNGTVEQDGIEADCSQSNVASYYAWYEMYGDSAINDGDEVQLPAGHPVSPGDAMSASISVVDNEWTLAISDSTQGWSYTRSPAITFSAAQESAEWIVERPEVDGDTGVPLADFGSVTFTNATVNGTTRSHLCVHRVVHRNGREQRFDDFGGARTAQRLGRELHGQLGSSRSLSRTFAGVSTPTARRLGVSPQTGPRVTRTAQRPSGRSGCPP